MAALAAGLMPIAAFAHDVTDPVCRMSVDSDTTPFHEKIGGKTFFFCTKACKAKFHAAPAKYSKLATALAHGGRHTYTVALTTPTPAQPNTPTALILSIRYGDGSKALVRDFELVHEKLVHLVLVSDDLSWFRHEHPTRGADGQFHLTWQFPHAGGYHAYADFTPADGDNQILSAPLTVGGGVSLAANRPAALVPETQWTRTVDGLTFSLAVQPGVVLRANSPALLTYTIRDQAGRPVRDMEPYLGAMGHLIALKQDLVDVVHTHALHSLPANAAPVSENGLKLTTAMATDRGPAQTFKLTLPSSGVYKVWAQFQRKGHVYTVPWTFRVKDLWDSSTPVASSSAVQKATIRVGEAVYVPASLRVQAGKPVELTFVAGKNVGCGATVVFPGLGIRQTLGATGKTVVSFTPKKAGVVRFTCGMNMYKGELTVR